MPYETRWKTGRSSAKVRATKSWQNFSQPTHPIQTIGPQNISLGSNGVYRVLFSCVSYYLEAFGTIWLPHETRCKTGRTSAKVRAMKLRRNFSQPTQPIHPIGPQNISLGSNGVVRVLFWCVSYHLGAFLNVWLPYETRWKTGRSSAKVRATKLGQNFLQQTHLIHPIWP